MVLGTIWLAQIDKTCSLVGGFPQISSTRYAIDRGNVYIAVIVDVNFRLAVLREKDWANRRFHQFHGRGEGKAATDVAYRPGGGGKAKQRQPRATGAEHERDEDTPGEETVFGCGVLFHRSLSRFIEWYKNMPRFCAACLDSKSCCFSGRSTDPGYPG